MLHMFDLYLENFAVSPALKNNLIVFILLFLSLSVLIFITYKDKLKFNNYFLLFAAFMITAMCNFYIVEILFSQSYHYAVNLLGFSIPVFLLNFLLYFLSSITIYFLTNNYIFSTGIISTLSLIFGLVNHYLLIFRNSPLLPWDLYSLSTAASVAGNYTYPISVPIMQGLLLFIALITLNILIFKQLRTSNIKKLHIGVRISCLIATLIIFIYMLSLLCNNYAISKYKVITNTWEQGLAYKQNGSLVSFINNLQYLDIEKPSGYSDIEAAAILNDFDSDATISSIDTTSDLSNLPNIIVVMSESYSDLRTLGDIQTNIPYMEYYDSIVDDLVHGTLFVSAYGGGTSTTEFEFLTSLTMSFLPRGSVPYQQHIKHPIQSLPLYLKEKYGYTTTAIHPYFASGWNRDKVYPILGFDKFISIENWGPQQEFVRSFVSDKSNYDEIISLFENKPKDEKAFIFNITMQNHGGYYDENFTSDVILTDAVNEYCDVEQYLSLMKISDESLRYLLEYFENYEEDTVILFFGDHQPSLDQSFMTDYLKDTYGLNIKQTPFFIWSNYKDDAEIAQEINLSTNYLSTLLLEYIGLEQMPINNSLQEFYQYFPIVVEDKFLQQDLTEITDQSAVIKTEYQKLQYYILNNNHTSFNK